MTDVVIAWVDGDDPIHKRKKATYLTPNKELNKQHIANIIFNDTKALKKINSIVHPRVKEDFAIWSKKQNCQIVAMETAILFEAGMQNSVDIIVAIYSDREICIQRACRRNNALRNEIEQRIDKQIATEKIIAQSDHAICNNPDTPILPQITSLLTKIITIWFIAFVVVFLLGMIAMTILSND